VSAKEPPWAGTMTVSAAVVVASWGGCFGERGSTRDRPDRGCLRRPEPGRECGAAGPSDVDGPPEARGADQHAAAAGGSGRWRVAGRNLCTLVAAMMAGGSHIDHANVLRAGATQTVLGRRVMAPSTPDTLLLETQQDLQRSEGQQLGVTKLRADPHLRAPRAQLRAVRQRVIDTDIECSREGVQVGVHETSTRVERIKQRRSWTPSPRFAWTSPLGGTHLGGACQPFLGRFFGNHCVVDPALVIGRTVLA
jgi:hypothetical protein